MTTTQSRPNPELAHVTTAAATNSTSVVGAGMAATSSAMDGLAGVAARAAAAALILFGRNLLESEVLSLVVNVIFRIKVREGA